VPVNADATVEAEGREDQPQSSLKSTNCLIARNGPLCYSALLTAVFCHRHCLCQYVSQLAYRPFQPFPHMSLLSTRVSLVLSSTVNSIQLLKSRKCAIVRRQACLRMSVNLQLASTLSCRPGLCVVQLCMDNRSKRVFIVFHTDSVHL